MVALRTRRAARALLGPDKLLEFTVHLLDLPAQAVRFLNVLNRHRALRVPLAESVSVGDHPVNVAVSDAQARL